MYVPRHGLCIEHQLPWPGDYGRFINKRLEDVMTIEHTDIEQTSNTPHKPARPMKFIKDDQGEYWLCDSDVDPSEDLAIQGCWRYEEMAFTRDD